ncbi:MAG: HNH endonuclease [Chloroflexi bacterium]|nr:MAG: HNH endonuclease [Chloroflexota bacterium]
MSYVFVIDQEKRPLDPVHPGRARKLLSSGKAAVYRRFPFVLILKHPVSEAHPQPLRLKIDPGSKTTGLAVLNDTSGQVLWAAELVHRGEEVHQALQKRAGVRRGRRSRHTRYRAARFSNRRRKRGWLAPSLCSRMQNVQTWTRRLMRWCPLGAISYEAVRFDTQAIQNPEIKGVAYQHGTLAGLEVKEYLLLKWRHKCVYCQKGDIPLEVEHIVPKRRGGSDRITNLTLACEACNQQKGSQTAQAFGFPHLQAQALQPLKDAAAVNSTRWALYERLKATGLPIEVSTGGQTKWNRKQRGIPKSHWLDAVCVGPSTPERVQWQHVIPLLITARGRQCRQLCNVDGWGFPRSRPKGPSKVFGFQTGDMVQAVVTRGKRMGTYVGRVAIKTDGYFKITGTHGIVEGIHARYCSPLHRVDGYEYQKGSAALPPQM